MVFSGIILERLEVLCYVHSNISMLFSIYTEFKSISAIINPYPAALTASFSSPVPKGIARAKA